MCVTQSLAVSTGRAWCQAHQEEMRSPGAQILVSKDHCPLVGTKALRERPDSRTGTGKALDELELPIVPRRKGALQR